MKIKKKSDYYIDLYEENQNRIDHTRTFVETLKVTGLDIIDAIISAGMPDIYLTQDEKCNRRDEISFKIKLFETFVSTDNANKLCFDRSKKKYLDSSEVGAINYWIGMILITILGKKKYQYEFIVHLSKLNEFSNTITLKKLKYLSATGKTIYKSPDLIAINCHMNRYGVFEAKGYSSYNKDTMERGYEQAKSIKRINGKKPHDTYVVMTITGQKTIFMIRKDPEGQEAEIEISNTFLNLYHYLPIVELMDELSAEEQNGRLCAQYENSGDTYSISIPCELNKILSPLLEFPNVDEDENKNMEYKKYLDGIHEILSDQGPLSEIIANDNIGNFFCVE